MNVRTKDLIRQKFPILFMIFKNTECFCRELLSKRYVKRLMKSNKEIMINAGGGDKKGENGWLNVDIKRNCDIFWELSRGIPFPENSVKKIYCSHFLEHLTFAEGQRFLKSCLKALVKGGTFSACVPNAKIFIEAYANGKTLDENSFLGYQPAYNRTTKIDYVNYIAYMDGQHKYMFDEENLIQVLKTAGFSLAAARKFDSTLDLVERDHESVYAEAVK